MSGKAKDARPLSVRLGELQEAVRAANVRVREVQADRSAEAEVERLSAARIEAFAAGDERGAAVAASERRDAQAAVQEHAERVAGAELAAQRAAAEHASFATVNFDKLLAERAEGAGAARQAVRDAVMALRESTAAWETFAADVQRLLQLAGRPTDAMPRLPGALTELARDAKRAAGVEVPAPLPIAMRSTVTIAPAHDPDPEARDAARAEILAKGGS